MRVVRVGIVRVEDVQVELFRMEIDREGVLRVMVVSPQVSYGGTS